MIKKYSSRIGKIDEKIFRDNALWTLSIPLGNLIEVSGVILSIILLYWSNTLNSTPSKWLMTLASVFLFSATIHPLAHYIVGKLFGIKFIFYFLNGPLKIEPTIKTDYASYLRASPKKRVMLHLSGGIATSLSPILMLIVSNLIGLSLPYFIFGGLFLFFISTEFIPLLLIKIGSPKIIGLDFRKSDSYRAMREWNLI